MTEPTDPTSREAQVIAVLDELLPNRPAGGWLVDELNDAGKIVLARHDEHHRVSHANAQRGGAIVWALRQRQMSWRAIYDATGIVQRTGARWAALFLAEGIAEQPAAELHERLQGGDTE
jgi:hypothetical protein